jgi:ankyrin repeat protein
MPGERGFPRLDLWPCDDPRPQSTTGETPLHVAAKNEHVPVEIVVALLNGPAAVDAVRVRASPRLWSRR